MRHLCFCVILALFFVGKAKGEESGSGPHGMSVVATEKAPSDQATKDAPKDAAKDAPKDEPQDSAIKEPEPADAAAKSTPADMQTPPIDASAAYPAVAASKDLLVVPPANARPDPAADAAQQKPDAAGQKDDSAHAKAKETPKQEDKTTKPDAQIGSIPPENAVVGAVEDNVAPPAFPLSRYSDLWENSPFQLESIAPPQVSEGLAQRYALTGIAYINGEPMVFFMERATQQRFMLKKDTDIAGISLVQVDEAKKYDDSTVTIRSGGEIGVIKFDAAPMTAFAQPQQPPGGAAPPQFIPPGANPASIPGGVPGFPNQQTQQHNQGGVSQNPPGIIPQTGNTGAGANHTAQQQQHPGQQQSAGPRIIRRRAIVPTAP